MRPSHRSARSRSAVRAACIWRVLPTAHRNIIVSEGDDYYFNPVPPVLRAIDPVRGTEVWRSPGFGAFVERNSLFYVDPDGDGKPQISFGAGAGAYLTR